jgi:hypothetical protein
LAEKYGRWKQFQSGALCSPVVRIYGALVYFVKISHHFLYRMCSVVLYMSPAPILGASRAMTVAMESLIAQLYSQSKHTTPRRENRKIQYENVTLKEKRSTQIYIFSLKNIPKIS